MDGGIRQILGVAVVGEIAGNCRVCTVQASKRREMSRSKERLVEEKRGLGEVVLGREESLTAVSGLEV